MDIVLFFINDYKQVNILLSLSGCSNLEFVE